MIERIPFGQLSTSLPFRYTRRFDRRSLVLSSDNMEDRRTVPEMIFTGSPQPPPPPTKVVHFETPSANTTAPPTPIHLVTSSSLTFPLIAEKPGARFKLIILLLSLLAAILVGFILSLLVVSQFIELPSRTSLPRRLLPSIVEPSPIANEYRFFDELDSPWIDQLDFGIDMCENFYGFVCHKWLRNHSLSPLEFKRSWFTERSNDIRQKFARELAELSAIEADQHRTETSDETVDIDDDASAPSTKNE